MNKKIYHLVHLKYIFGICLCFLFCLLAIGIASLVYFKISIIEKSKLYYLASFYFFIIAFCFKSIFYKKIDNKISKSNELVEAIYQDTNEISCRNIKEMFISEKRSHLAVIFFIRPKKYCIAFSKNIRKFSSLDIYMITLHEIAHAKTHFPELMCLLDIFKITFAFLAHFLYCVFLNKYGYTLEFSLYLILSLTHILVFYLFFAVILKWTHRQGEYLADIIAVKLNKGESRAYIKTLKKISRKEFKTSWIPLNHNLFDSHPAIGRRIKLIENVFQK